MVLEVAEVKQLWFWNVSCQDTCRQRFSLVRYSWKMYVIEVRENASSMIRTINTASSGCTQPPGEKTPNNRFWGRGYLSSRSSCPVHDFLLRLLHPCESRIQRKGKKTGLSNAGLSHVWCLQPFQIKTQIFLQSKITLPRSWGRVHLSSCLDWAAPWRAPSDQVLLPRLLPQVVVTQELGWGKDSAAA